MTLEEMGAHLRQERERQGISLEKIASEIKIGKKYLLALEEGRKDDLPHPVYAKGFVKNYARLLGLDPEEMAGILSQHYDVDDDQLRESPRYDAKESAPSIREKRVSFASGKRSRGFQPSLWIAIPVVLLFAVLAWFFLSSGAGTSLEGLTKLFSSKSDTQSQQSTPQVAAPAVPPETKTSTKAEAKPEPSQTETVAAQRDVQATLPIFGNKPVAQPGPPPAQSITPANLDNEAQFAATGNQSVEINANQPAKLEVTDEAGQNRSFSLLKGQRLTLKFNAKIGVRFVSAPSVALKLNGKDYPLEGGKAEGRSIQFP